MTSVTAMSGEDEGGEVTDDDEGGNSASSSAASSSAAARRLAAAAASPSKPTPLTGRKTSYMTFCDSLREQVKAELLEQGGGDPGAAKLTNVSKELAGRWRELSEAEKAEWQKVAKQQGQGQS